MASPTVTTNKSNRAVTPAPSAPVPAAAKSQAIPAATAKSGKAATPGHEEIAKRAYELYLGRGQTSGKETEDWIQAERELAARSNGRN